MTNQDLSNVKKGFRSGIVKKIRNFLLLAILALGVFSILGVRPDEMLGWRLSESQATDRYLNKVMQVWEQTDAELKKLDQEQREKAKGIFLYNLDEDYQFNYAKTLYHASERIQRLCKRNVYPEAIETGEVFQKYYRDTGRVGLALSLLIAMINETELKGRRYEVSNTVVGTIARVIVLMIEKKGENIEKSEAKFSLDVVEISAQLETNHGYRNEALADYLNRPNFHKLGR